MTNWKDSEWFRDHIEASTTLAEALKRMGVSTSSFNYQQIRKYSIIHGVSIEHLQHAGIVGTTRAAQQRAKLRRISHDEMFKEHSTTDRSVVRRRILSQQLIPYVCGECDIGPEWKGKTLVLHLEHRNGVGTDNRLQNLCFLCPNCHSQTETYAGRNVRREG